MKLRTITLDEVSLAWLAGILEGEGSFMTHRNTVAGKSYYYPKVQVSMTDRDIIVRVAYMLGTKAHGPFANKTQAGRKPFWSACVTGHPAAGLMADLLPLMGERRSARIVDILAAWEARVPTSVLRSESCKKATKDRPRLVDGTFA